MRKFYFLMLACAMFAMTASAQVMNLQKNSLPEGVKHFLETPVGKKFSADQIMSVWDNQPAQGAHKAVQTETVFIETFDNLTAGSQDAPDNLDLGAQPQEFVDGLADNPGWTMFLTYQAGGCVYLGFDEVGDDGPGYLMTPDMDLLGVYRFHAKVKNVNPNAQGVGLQYFILDNDPANPHMLGANTLPMTSEWTEVELEIGYGVPTTAIMFYSWAGKILVDDVMIEKVTYTLDTPENINCEMLEINKLHITWDAVENAQSYKVMITNYATGDASEFIADTNSLDADFEFAPSEGILVNVVAVNEEGESYPGKKYFPTLGPTSLEAPVALDATDVTENGFTAHWQPVSMAYDYKLFVNHTHTVAQEGEELVYFDDDFSSIPFDSDDARSTVMTQDGQLVLLDDYLAYPGWGSYLISVQTGMIGISNVYESFGFPGVLIGPKADYSFGGGKVKISGTGMSFLDDCIVTVGWAKDNPNAFGSKFVFDGETKEIEMAPGNPQTFSVELEGGTAGSRIMFKMTDAVSGGDMACFVGELKISTDLSVGDHVSRDLPVAKASFDATSAEVNCAFSDGDICKYCVTANYGDVVSPESNVIVVKRQTEGVEAITECEDATATYYTVDGRMADAANTPSGVYVVRKGGKTVKVMK